MTTKKTVQKAKTAKLPEPKLCYAEREALVSKLNEAQKLFLGAMPVLAMNIVAEVKERLQKL